MTKAEILEAINATIAPNGVKGITAESLANILTEIVNATPEGGSGGAGGEYIDMTMANPDDPMSMELTPEAMAHNAALYTSICEALNNGGVLPPVSVNASIMGMYASSVALEEDLLMFYFHGPIANEPSNYFVEAITKEGTSNTLIIGGDLTLMVVVLDSTGAAVISTPGA
jgi:hypothetical protein